jgi:hypothetical protein
MFFVLRLPLVLLLLLACNSCSSPVERQAALKSATDAYGDCVMHAVARLDDGKSDPMSIAYGIAPQCAGLYQAVTDSVTRGMITEAGIAATRERARATELRIITSAVLTYRAASPAGKRALAEGTLSAQ